MSDDNIVYDETDGIFKLNPLVVSSETFFVTHSYHDEDDPYNGWYYKVWVGLPGVDLASVILAEQSGL